jgi:uncharacterized protein with GYD domain
MPHYLLQAAYTPQAWQGLVRNPQDRAEALKPVIARMGGTIESAYFSFGEYDFIFIVQMPGNVDAAAFSLAAAAGGAVKSLKTTPLLTPAEGLEAIKKAGTSGYTPPKGS